MLPQSLRLCTYIDTLPPPQTSQAIAKANGDSPQPDAKSRINVDNTDYRVIEHGEIELMPYRRLTPIDQHSWCWKYSAHYRKEKVAINPTSKPCDPHQ